MKDMFQALDPSGIQAFVFVVDLASFSRAAEALGTTQSTISLRIKRLEQRLGRRLLDRTPRSVRVSSEGQCFIGPARDLLTAYERALGAFARQRIRIVLGVSHHLVGPSFPRILKRLAHAEPACLFEVRVASSTELIRDLDEGDLDGILLLRQEGDRRSGVTVCRQPLGWYAARGWVRDAAQPIPLATQADPCGLRALAIQALKRAKIPWTELFVGGGVAVLGAAIEAGLAVGVLARSVASGELEDVTGRYSLPKLRPSEVILDSRTSDQATKRALHRFTMAYRAETG